MRRPLLALTTFAALALGSAAFAETDPWVAGVTTAQKTAAQKSLEAGNALFIDRKYAEALEQYRAAIASWDHPAIRFNVVRCLIQLDRPVEAADNLKLALKYGAAPLEDTVYTEALSYQKLLANQIAEVAVDCTQAGVKLTLDGQHLASCPASESRRIAPGSHQLVGTKEGFLTRTIEVVALGGTQQQVKLSLDPLTRAARIEHKWATWKPWAVFAGGFVIGGIGGLFQLSAGSDMDRYDQEVQLNCADLACDEMDLGNATDWKDNALFKNKLGVSMMVAGGVTVVTGAVLLYVNRGRTVYPRSVEKMMPTVAPVAGGGAAMMWTGAF